MYDRGAAVEGRVHAVGLPELLGPWGKRLVERYAVRTVGGRGVQRGPRRLHLRHPEPGHWLGGLHEPATGSHCAAQGSHRPIVEKLPMPVTYIYGEHDWMDPEAACSAADAASMALLRRCCRRQPLHFIDQPE